MMKGALLREHGQKGPFMQEGGRTGEVVLRDPKAIRALAHPARLLVIQRLFSGEPATATSLADTAGLSASAMSYHLRALERFGIVERAEPTGDGRERPWRATGRTIRVDSAAPTATVAVEGALIGAVLESIRREIERFISGQADEPAEWRDAAGLDSTAVTLTPDELARLRDDLAALLAHYRSERRASPPQAARRVRFTTIVVPQD
jgi:DNA-binding transcriptional ArsR family regulator